MEMRCERLSALGPDRPDAAPPPAGPGRCTIHVRLTVCQLSSHVHILRSHTPVLPSRYAENIRIQLRVSEKPTIAVLLHIAGVLPKLTRHRFGFPTEHLYNAIVSAIATDCWLTSNLVASHPALCQPWFSSATPLGGIVT